MIIPPHLISVDVVESIKQHLHDLLDLCQRELYIGITQQTSEVMLTEVKHQVDAAFVSVVLGRFKVGDKYNRTLKNTTETNKTTEISATTVLSSYNCDRTTFFNTFMGNANVTTKRRRTKIQPCVYRTV